jgi:hypothetical protein
MSHTTASYAGTTGSVSLGGEIENIKLVVEMNTPDVTSMASGGYTEYIGCLVGGSGTFDTWIPCGITGTHTGIDFVEGTSGQTMSSDIVIGSIKTSGPVEGAVKYTYSFQTTGTITGLGIPSA